MFRQKKNGEKQRVRVADKCDQPGKPCTISIYALRKEDDGIYNEFPRVFVSS